MTAPDGARDVVVVGGGVIGRAIAWRLAQGGRDVELFDPDPTRAAALVAAGMLAPVSEATPDEGALAALGLAAVERWTDFTAELERASGISIDHRTTGTTWVALDPDGLVELAELQRRLESMGLAVVRLSAAECRSREPLLAPSVRGGLEVSTDNVVDPRLLMAALEAAAEEAGVTTTCRAVTEVVDGGVQLDDGQLRTAVRVIVAAGAWSGQLIDVPVRPVRGETLHLAAMDGQPVLSGNVRGIVDGRGVYLAARSDGRVVVGATMEERGFDTRTRVGPVRDLLRDARAVVPAVDELELTEIAVGLRPGSPDNGPLLGELRPGLVVATGHFRSGILLAPITAEAVAAMVTGEPVHAAVEPFHPQRFGPRR